MSKYRITQKVIVLFITLAVLFGCEDDYYPPGLYGSQVERLLAGDSSKIWLVAELRIDGERQQLEDCEDSVKVVFVSNEANTRVDVFDLRYQPGCTEYDTIYYGVLTASTAFGDDQNNNLFTDTLLFEGGEVDYLILEDINPLEARWRKRDSVTSFYRLVAQ